MKKLPFNNTLNLAATSTPVITQVIPQFQRTVSYFNTSGRIVTVSDRIGMKVEVHSDNTNTLASFIIRLEYALTPDQRGYFEREVLPANGEDCGLLLKLKEAYKRDVKLKRISPFNKITLSIELGIDLEAIDNIGGSVYLEDLDIVLSTRPGDKSPVHPLSIKGSLKELSARVNPTTGFQYLYVCNDDCDDTDPLYCVLNDLVFPIRPVIEPSMRNGLYVTLPEDKHGMRDTYIYETEEEVKENVDLIRVFIDEFSAREYVAKSSSITLKIAELKKQTEEISAVGTLSKAELLLKNTEYDKDKTLLDIDKLTADKEKLIADKEKLLADKELAKVKNNYEHQSHVRKDSSEILKHIPVVILGLAAIAGALYKVFG